MAERLRRDMTGWLVEGVALEPGSWDLVRRLYNSTVVHLRWDSQQGLLGGEVALGRCS